MSNFIYRHDKNNWTVMLWDDGTLLVYSRYANRLNTSHQVHLYDTLVNLPQYVLQMVYDLREEHRSSLRLPLSERIVFSHWQHRIVPLQISFSTECWGEHCDYSFEGAK
jgi:hypothetical protein